jgi:hypothetical protein
MTNDFIHKMACWKRYLLLLSVSFALYANPAFAQQQNQFKAADTSSAFELGEQLASIPLADSWDQRRAETWWTENMPNINQDGSTASITETMVRDSGDTE